MKASTRGASPAGSSCSTHGSAKSWSRRVVVLELLVEPVPLRLAEVGLHERHGVGLLVAEVLTEPFLRRS